MKNKAFPGRVVFDHLPKTAGQSIHHWLVDTLGSGCVTPNLIGTHTDLIRQYGGMFSIISAHIGYHQGEQLDPRYQYITVIRDPIDRTISWLYFVLTNQDFELRDLRAIVARFIESDGQDLDKELPRHITNVYVEHFCRICHDGQGSEEDNLAAAFEAIKQYDIVGLFSDLPRFCADVASMLDIPAPMEISRVNITPRRPMTNQISSALMAKIVELNKLDCCLFEQILAYKGLPVNSKWKKFDRISNRVFGSPNLAILKALLREGNVIFHRQQMTFDVDFMLAKSVQNLEIFIQIFDSNGLLVFGTSSASLGQSFPLLPIGVHNACCELLADLPPGNYTAGFGFTERSPEGPEELAWQDFVYDFEVRYETNFTYTGYAYLPTVISLSAPKTHAYIFQASADLLCTEVGKFIDQAVVTTGQAGFLIYGPYIPLLAGKYEVIIHCLVGKGGLGGANVEISADKCSRVIVQCGFEGFNSSNSYYRIPIQVDEPCSDFEVRVWVSENTDLQILKLEVLFGHSVQELKNTAVVASASHKHRRNKRKKK